MESGKKKTKNPNTSLAYDLAVIGSGPSGIYAAIQAAKLQKRVCIIEKNPEKIGGAWVHTGTLPSKTLREALASIYEIRSHTGSDWVQRIVQDLGTDKLFNRARKVSAQEENLLLQHLKNNKIEILRGSGSLDDAHTVRIINSVEGCYTIKSESILIATGSRPRRPENIPFDGWRVVDSDEILSLENVPKSLIIYGGGVIGCEYACIFAALGTDTTIIDSRSHLMQQIDQEVVGELQKAMEALGVKFKLGYELDSVEFKGPKVLARCGEHSQETDVFFFAAGRVSNSDHLGLDRLGIKVNDRGAIFVNENFQTSLPNIYAAGDVIGPPALAATSFDQGRHVACHAFGAPHPEFPKLFPVGVYTIPELSSVGPSEEELKKKGIDYVVGHAGYGELARGYIGGSNHGILKILICKSTHKLLGIHIVGHDACNLVHIGLAFMMKGGYAQDMLNMVFNYPTLAEGYRVAAFNALNKLFPAGMIEDPPEVKAKKQSAA